MNYQQAQKQITKRFRTAQRLAATHKVCQAETKAMVRILARGMTVAELEKNLKGTTGSFASKKIKELDPCGLKSAKTKVFHKLRKVKGQITRAPIGISIS